MKNSKVIIVEDELAVRDSLSEWLLPDYEVSCFDSAEAFMDAINQLQMGDGLSTCILLDFQMPGMTGVELQANLKLLNIDFPILFMSGNAQQSDIIDAWRGGAVDFILKPFSGTELSNALVQIFQKSNDPKSSLSTGINSEALLDLPITQREAEVLQLLGQGRRQNEVADLLGITLRTVKMYRANLKNKLNLNTVIELARYYDEHSRLIKKIAQSPSKKGGLETE